MIVRVGEAGFENLWQQLIQNTLQLPPFYSKLNKQYQCEYYKDRHFTDVSFIIYEQAVPLTGLVSSVSMCTDGVCELSNYGNPLLVIPNPSLPTLTLLKTGKILVSEIERIIQAFQVSVIHLRDLLNQVKCTQLTHYLLSQGATATPGFTSVLDLSLPIETLRQNVRKSYKSLINWGLKNLELEIIDSTNVNWAEVEACRNLHIEVAGKETRSLQTWELQYQMIKHNEAFLITGKLSSQLVTFGLFLYSPHYCYYGVSASKRELFDKPLFHALMWQSICFAKNLGCRYLETGDIIYPKQGNPTQKEIDIGNFKKGFGGDVQVVLDVCWRKE